LLGSCAGPRLSCSMLKRAGTRTGQKYVVAIDGSNAGHRAARLAAFLAQGALDRIELVSITDGSNDKTMEEHLKHAKDDITALKDRLHVDTFVKPAANIADALCTAASGGILCMGAGGMRLQEEWLSKKSSSAAAATGSVALACMARCKAPVIICKKSGAEGILDKGECVRRRGNEKIYGMKIVVAVAASDDPTSIKSLDMARRVSFTHDSVHIVHVKTANHSKASDEFWTIEAQKTNSVGGKGEYSYVNLEMGNKSIDKVIHGYCEDQDSPAHLVILSSRELAKLDGQALGSVSAALAKSTEANIMISKHFVQ